MSLTPNSPRLPSPPPAAEIQIGSPSMASTAATRQAQVMEQTILVANAKRRIRPGTRAADMAAGPPIVPLDRLDSAFQLQEHLAALHYYHSASNTQPMTRTTSVLLARAPPSTDRTLWLYELCRFLIAQCNTLIVGFLFDTPPCSATTCPEMRASEWQFLCAVHEQPKSCCAIDYCCHTLDWAANVVTNPKLFPSRFVLHQDSHDKSAAVKSLINVFRRLHRIFAHAWFQHRGVFWSVESQSGLYVLFKTVCDMYDLLPAENYKLPPEAEGLESQGAPLVATAHRDEEKKQQQQQPQVSIIARPSPQRGDSGVLAPDDDNLSQMNRTNTSRRHVRSSPSTGSAVTTVMETDEEGLEIPGSRLREVHASAPETVQEEPEVAEVPVIVEETSVSAQDKDLALTSMKQDEERDDATADDAFPEILTELKSDSSNGNRATARDEDGPQVASAGASDRALAEAAPAPLPTNIPDFAQQESISTQSISSTSNIEVSETPGEETVGPIADSDNKAASEEQGREVEDAEDEEEEEDDDDSGGDGSHGLSSPGATTHPKSFSTMKAPAQGEDGKI